MKALQLEMISYWTVYIFGMKIWATTCLFLKGKTPGKTLFGHTVKFYHRQHKNSCLKLINKCTLMLICIYLKQCKQNSSAGRSPNGSMNI